MQEPESSPITVNVTPNARVKPRWRGVSHQYAFFASIPLGLALVFAAPTTRAAIGAATFTASLAALLGTSALYHRITWQPSTRYWLGQFDRAMIFVLIAGSYTPIALAAPPHDTAAATTVWAIWGIAAAGVVLTLFLKDAPKWGNSLLYVVMGSLGAFMVPEIIRSLGVAAVGLFTLGGALYITGAVVYGLERPDPFPRVFGYHEIFHALVVIAATVHFVAMAVYVLPYQA